MKHYYDEVDASSNMVIAKMRDPFLFGWASGMTITIRRFLPLVGMTRCCERGGRR
jgi:hypothetical protein